MIRTGSIEEVQKLINWVPEFTLPPKQEALEERLSAKSSLILVAEDDGQLVGFKCGYEREKGKETFYSWLGGVVPDKRRNGVAQKLLQAMEQWCVAKGYQFLRFKTLNRHKTMLLFALKNEFMIQAVEESEKDAELRIWLIKKLKG